MNVVHLVPAIFGEDGIVGGAERYAMETGAAHGVATCQHASSLSATAIAASRAEPWRFVSSVLRGTCVDSGANPFHPGLFSALEDADVVHCHQQHVLMSSAAAAWCRLRGKRVFVSELGGGGWDISAYVSTDAWFHGHLHLSEYSRRIFRARAVVLGASHRRWSGHERFSPDRAIARGGNGAIRRPRATA